MTRTLILLASALVTGAGLGPGLAAAQPLPPQMHTVAGGGSCVTPLQPPPVTPPTAFPCNGVKATSVPIDEARSVAALPSGGFLYVDEGEGLVQEVSPSGTVTTVGGGSTSCSYANGATCDGMPATSVELADPVAAVPLPGGGFLVTEYAGARVLMVSPGDPGTATITTIAGTGTAGPDHGATGAATSIPLDYPSDAEPTADGGVLIANSGSDDIRYVAPDGTVSTVAGEGSCNDATSPCDGLAATQIALNQPVSVSPIQGGSGGYLIAEYGADAIDRVDPSGAFTTVAGSPGQPGYGGDGGPAVGAQLRQPEQVVSLDGGGFLIADTSDELIRQVSPAGTITTVAGTPLVASVGGDGGAATAALLDHPAAVAQLPNGNVLIADEDNNLIREVTLPSVSTIVLNPSSPNGANGWYTSSSVTATVSATEGAAVNCILDPGAAPPAFGAIPTGCPFSVKGGAAISGNGVHTLYAASMNSFGDQEDPVDAVVKIDTSPPTTSCNGTPSFRAGARHASVTATVTDSVSGPVNPIISAPANTARVGVHRALLVAENNAGFLLDIFCNYNVLPVSLKPLPRLRWAFTTVGAITSVRRLAVSDVAAQAQVNVDCHGSGCPFSSAVDVTGGRCAGAPCKAKRKQLRRRRTVDLTQLFSGSQLGAGVRLTVSVTKANTVGGVWIFTIRAGKGPSHLISCLAPGSSKPGQGCATPPR